MRRALWDERSLLKAWTLRGTLHLHPAEELPLWFAARRAVSAEADELPAWPDPHGVLHPPVGNAEVADLRRAVWDAFEGRALLRDELVTKVVEQVGNKHEGRLRSGFAFFLSELCQGPPQGNKITLALDNASFTVAASNSSVTIASSGDSVTITGTNDTITVSGGNDTVFVTDGNAKVTITGINDVVTLQVSITANDQTVTVANSNDLVLITGNNDVVNITGTNDIVTFSRDTGTLFGWIT